MLTKKIAVHIELTPEELAFELSNMDDSQQAAFFNELARLTERWERPFCFQLQWLTENHALTPEGRRIMEQIGEYAQVHSTNGGVKRHD